MSGEAITVAGLLLQLSLVARDDGVPKSKQHIFKAKARYMNCRGKRALRTRRKGGDTP